MPTRFERPDENDAASGWWRAARDLIDRNRALLLVANLCFILPTVLIRVKQFPLVLYWLAPILSLVPVAVIAAMTLPGSARISTSLFLRQATLLSVTAVFLYTFNPFSLFAGNRVFVAKWIFFCTDRDPSENRGLRPTKICGEDREACAIVSVGRAKAFIRIAPGISTPWDTEVSVNPPDAPEIHSLQPGDFYSLLSERVNQSPQKDAFLFVHGFRNSFDEAIYRAAAMSLDLKFKGPPIVFSWPAEHEFAPLIWRNYPADVSIARKGSNDLAVMLPILRLRSGAKHFQLIAHSLGTEVASQAILQARHELCASPKPFENVILAASDIPPELFETQSDALLCSTERLTIYHSRTDKALLSSSVMQERCRLGRGCPAVSGADVIDATDVDSGFIGHSYLFEGPVLADVYTMFLMGNPTIPADERKEIEKDQATGRYRLVSHLTYEQ
jgi:hypothetical protein